MKQLFIIFISLFCIFTTVNAQNYTQKGTTFIQNESISKQKSSAIETKYTWQDLYSAIHGDIGLTPICGQNDLFSRYLTEDVSCALVPWAYIGRAIGVKTPTIDAIINLYSIIHDKNWWEEGV